MLILVVTGKTLEEDCQVLHAFPGVLGGIEIRVDCMESPETEDWDAFFHQFPYPAILTIRKKEEGGQWKGTEEERISLFKSLIQKAGFTYITVECDKNGVSPLPLEEVALLARSKGLTVIRSFRDRIVEPAEISSFLHAFSGRRGEIPEVTVYPEGCRDLKKLLDALEGFEHLMKIILPLGPYGFPLRILAEWFGSCFTFATPPHAQTVQGPAEDLIDLETLHTVYRYPQVHAIHQLFGIIGNPVLHSRSPHIHNTGYTALNIPAVYVPFLVDDLSEFFPLVKKLQIQGLSVTVPFKEAVLPYCDWYEEAVAAVGACNTLVFDPGTVRGYNTDVEGFLAPLKEQFQKNQSSFLEGKRALVLGAGGASRAVVYGLAHSGARVVVLNRTVERAERLARDMEKALQLPIGAIETGPLDTEGARKASVFQPDIIVQTTTRGMHPHENEDAFPQLSFRGIETVYDLVYAPRDTYFLKRARGAGCSVIYGDAMLVHQAFRQFLLFTGKEYPRQIS
jgi:3-dehydroquinate dehydratase/shikimate dehydrogenase